MIRPRARASCASWTGSWPAAALSASARLSGWRTGRAPLSGAASPVTCSEMRMITMPAPIAVALDAPSLDTAARWASLVTPHVSTVKIGLELYLRYGPDAVASIRGASGVKVFLDLKLHDIPATVAGAGGAGGGGGAGRGTGHAAAGGGG